VANEKEAQMSIKSNQVVPLIDLNEAGIVITDHLDKGYDDANKIEPEDVAEVIEPV
jgi:hypothetical protein